MRVNSIFLLNDSIGNFAIKTEDILHCVAFAIKSGDLPKLPSEWTKTAYGCDYEELSYPNDKKIKFATHELSSEDMNNNTGDNLFNNCSVLCRSERVICDNCSERCVFYFADKYSDTQRAVGLTTILKCLEYLVKCNCLPLLPLNWCGAVQIAVDVYIDDELTYNEL